MSDSFEYLGGHILHETHHVMEMSQRARDRLLTILSFCLIGILTFAAAYSTQETTPYSYLLVICFLGVSLIFWLIAFIVTIFRNPTRGAMIIPGQSENIPFLPYIEEKEEFRNCKQYSPFDADAFFAAKAILRMRENKLSESEKQRYETYLSRLATNSLKYPDYTSLMADFRNYAEEDDNCLHSFCKNTWLAALVHLNQGVIKQYEHEMGKHRVVRWLFTISMTMLILAVISSMIPPEVWEAIIEFITTVLRDKAIEYAALTPQSHFHNPIILYGFIVGI